MDQDPRTATVDAKIRFKGIMLMCINKNMKNRCEVGFINCPKHDAKLTIATVGQGGVKGPERVRCITHDLYIQVTNPQDEAKGVIRRNVGDDTDFKHLPDLEGPDLHTKKVHVDNDSLLTKLAINAGELYSHLRTEEEYDLIEWSEDDIKGKIIRKFGPLVDELALNVVCQDGLDSGITIIDASDGSTIEHLPKIKDTHYEIEIKDDCGDTSTGVGPSDFRFYYQVITADDGKRYDFEQNVRGEPSPRICERAFLSKTDSLGFSFEPDAIRPKETKQRAGRKSKSKK